MQSKSFLVFLATHIFLLWHLTTFCNYVFLCFLKNLSFTLDWKPHEDRYYVLNCSLLYPQHYARHPEGVLKYALNERFNQSGKWGLIPILQGFYENYLRYL